jgi:hypothetical protein
MCPEGSLPFGRRQPCRARCTRATPSDEKHDTSRSRPPRRSPTGSTPPSDVARDARRTSVCSVAARRPMPTASARCPRAKPSDARHERIGDDSQIDRQPGRLHRPSPCRPGREMNERLFSVLCASFFMELCSGTSVDQLYRNCSCFRLA